jgi:molybdopterin synthase catalytic subunit
MFRIASAPLEPDALRGELSATGAGGVVTFEGRVRSQNAGREVCSLDYEAYGGLAEKEGARILAEAREKFGLCSAWCVHRVGHLRAGEIAVWVGVGAAHRGSAFDACRFIVDEMKRRVPIWKKEHYAGGAAAWISHPAEGADRPPAPPQSTRVSGTAR